MPNKRIQLRLHRYRLPLHRPFRTAHGVREAVNTLIVELHDPDRQLSGYGEAPEIGYYPTGTDDHVAALEAARDDIEHVPPDEPPDAAWDRLNPQLGPIPFAQNALDQALWDLHGKRLGQPTHALWGLTTDRCPLSDYTIGLGDLDAMRDELLRHRAFRIFKIKLGTPPDAGGPQRDIEILQALRECTEATFRVDANTAWNADTAIALSHRLAALGVEFIEQPLPVDRLDDMPRVKTASALPIIADESCQTEADVDRLAQAFHGVNIKLTKCGGLTPGRRMALRARALGLRVMAGCMTESTVGISALGQLLPLLDDVDMDGALLIGEANDIATGVRLDPTGRAIYPTHTHGNGVTLTRHPTA